jgi:hypothetical protein
MALPVMTINGDVVAVHSYWTDDGSQIMTEATVRGPDGTDVVVTQLGGSVDGIGMITMPGPAPLALGMTVALAAHHAVDLGNADHIMIDSARILATPADYVRTGPTKSGHSLYWESGCVFVTIDAAGTKALSGDTAFSTVDASIDTWNNSTAACSYLKVMDQGRKSLEVGRDHINLIKFRDTACSECLATMGTTWCRPAVSNAAAVCHSPSAAGITTAVFVDDPTSARDGAIVDADIEINGVNFAISANGATNSTVACRAELQNTLTHELGHLHGLEHPCVAAGELPPGAPTRVDNLGNPAPMCSDVQAAPLLPANMKILDSTMYNFQDCSETKKETLSSDDIDAICAIYPTSDDPKTCAPVAVDSGGCCSASGGSDRPDVGLVLAGATVLTVLRRRKLR